VNLDDVWPPLAGRVTMTMGEGQWDALLEAAYDQDCVLIEVDDDERPVRAYQRGETV